MEASRWDRLHDAIARLDRYELRLREVEEDTELIGRIDERLKNVETKVDSCLANQKNLEKWIHKRDEQAAMEYKQQRKDHQAQRKWIYGAIVATAAVLVAAVGLFVQILQNSP